MGVFVNNSGNKFCIIFLTVYQKFYDFKKIILGKAFCFVYLWKVHVYINHEYVLISVLLISNSLKLG